MTKEQPKLAIKVKRMMLEKFDGDHVEGDGKIPQTIITYEDDKLVRHQQQENGKLVDKPVDRS